MSITMESSKDRAQPDVWPEYMPVRQPWAEPFWTGLSLGELMLQKCNHCARSYYPFVEIGCTQCGQEVTWFQAVGDARLWSWVTFHREYYSDYPLSVPYTVISVDLPEGIRMLATLASNINPAALKCDMALRFNPIELSTGVFIPGFRPTS